MKYDVIIIGAGPAGATAAIYLGKSGKSVLLIDKARFPRDKICGDAQSGKSLNILRDLNLLNEFEKCGHQQVRKVHFSSPKGYASTVNFTKNDSNAFGFCIPRKKFDHILFKEAKTYVSTLENASVKDIILDDNRVKGVTVKHQTNTLETYFADVVIGADGFQSIISKKLGLYEYDMNHMLVATRCYYKNVSCDTDTIELHFVDGILPGYFWIFPVGDGIVNVGIGTTQADLKQKNINIREAHERAINSQAFKDRFKHAEELSPIKGWNLPVGSKRRQIHGHGYILIGDAAGLIDPLSGEGIGNAMVSGKIAAQTLLELDLGNLKPDDLSLYTERLWKRIGGELAVMTKIQKMLKYKSFINFITKQAQNKQDVAEWIGNMVAGTMSKKMLFSPKTYLKMMFG